jgi:hypothetical protein
MQGLSGYELNIGDQVEVLDNYRDRTDGFLIGTVTRFVDKDGNPGDALVLITPNHTVLRDEHPHGVRVGSAHWGTLVRRLDDQPGTIEEAGKPGKWVDEPGTWVVNWGYFHVAPEDASSAEQAVRFAVFHMDSVGVRQVLDGGRELTPEVEVRLDWETDTHGMPVLTDEEMAKWTTGETDAGVGD